MKKIKYYYNIKMHSLKNESLKKIINLSPISRENKLFKRWMR